jgi:hypothetical protein
VPPSFLDVIDCLVDVLLRYHGPPSEEGKDGAQSGTAGGAAGVVRPGEVHVVSNPDGTIDLLPTATAAAEAAKKKAAEEAERGKPLSAPQKEVAVQCFALKLLSDFTLMYQHCVGVLLKRDTDLSTKEAVALRGSTAKKASQQSLGQQGSGQQVCVRAANPLNTHWCTFIVLQFMCMFDRLLSCLHLHLLHAICNAAWPVLARHGPPAGTITMFSSSCSTSVSIRSHCSLACSGTS